MKEVVLISGGTGNIGRKLTKLLLSKGFEIIILTRKTSKISEREDCSYAHWNPEKKEVDAGIFRQVDYIINLAGENIGNKKWTSTQKNKILESRVSAGKLLSDTLSKVPNRVKAVISASAIGYYAADVAQGTRYAEDDAPGDNFLAKVCVAWEQSVQPIENMLDKRLVIFRTAVVMDQHSGPVHEFLKFLKWRIATILGPGDQKMSWIHIDDVCNAYLHAIQNENLHGIYNLCTPQITTYRQAVLKLAKTKFDARFIPIKIPGFLLKLIMGEMAEEMILTSTSTSPSKLINTHFKFLYPSFGRACVQSLVRNL